MNSEPCLSTGHPAIARLLDAVTSLEKLPHIVGDLYVAIKNPSEGTGWSFACAGIVESDLRELLALCLTATGDTGEGAIAAAELALAAQHHRPTSGREALTQLLCELRAARAMPQSVAAE